VHAFYVRVRRPSSVILRPRFAIFGGDAALDRAARLSAPTCARARARMFFIWGRSRQGTVQRDSARRHSRRHVANVAASVGNVQPDAAACYASLDPCAIYMCVRARLTASRTVRLLYGLQKPRK